MKYNNTIQKTIAAVSLYLRDDLKMLRFRMSTGDETVKLL